VTSVLFCSLDSFLASLGIGLFGIHESRRRKLILAFAMFDFSATLAGVSLHAGMAQIHTLGVGLRPFLVTAVLGVGVLAALAYSRKDLGAFLWVPALLSLDNFIAGFVGAFTPAPSLALMAGLVSGLAAWAGLVTALHLGPMFTRRFAIAASATLLILAFVLAN
jgi:hypothetical protein